MAKIETIGLGGQFKVISRVSVFHFVLDRFPRAYLSVFWLEDRVLIASDLGTQEERAR